MVPFQKARFRALAHMLEEATGLGCALVEDGIIVADFASGYDWQRANGIGMSFQHMIAESARWGEPQITIDSEGGFVWCVPVFLNNEVVGGLFAGAAETFNESGGPRAIYDAAWKLLELAESLNLCNSASMRQNRLAALADARRAEALHVTKQFRNPRDIYLVEEEKLLRAIRERDLELAREIINNILIGVYQLGSHRFDMLKPLVLEMVVQMYRAGVEEGADPTELLGMNSGMLVDLLGIDDEYDLNLWLTRWLERFVNVGFDTGQPRLPRSLAPVILYIKNNLNKPLSRERVAKACNLSPGYLSHLLKSATGYTFTDMVNRFRSDHACSLLDHTAMTASEIAFAAGFNDQSYFTKVFKRYQGTTPGAYRARSTAGTQGSSEGAPARLH
jgi:AraC-like DNA-binding protein